MSTTTARLLLIGILLAIAAGVYSLGLHWRDYISGPSLSQPIQITK